MSTAKKLPLGLALIATAFCLSGTMALAEGWQAVWQDPSPSAPKTVTQVDWQQQVLRRPEGAQRNERPVEATRQPAPRSRYERDPFAEVTVPRQGSVMTGGARTRLISDEPEVIPPGTPLAPQAQDGPAIMEDSGFNPSFNTQRGGCKNCNRNRGEFVGEISEGMPGGDCDSCDTCDSCDPCGAPCEEVCDFGWELFDGRCGPWLRGLSVFAGADSFKGPLGQGTNGNFGFNEGLNLARPLGDPWGCGYQIGVNFVQSEFSGSSTRILDRYDINAPYRKQYFATAAIFRRAECRGFQWGVAYDYLHDIYYQNADLQQIRSQTGFVLDDVYEIGYYGAYGVSTDQDRVLDGKLDPTDMFVGYIRRNFENGGDGRLWGGATGNGDALIGADLWVPLGNSFALENRINYMIPKQGRGEEAQARESWGLLMQIVWYPGQNAKCQRQNPFRPMFNVADNSLFMVDRLAR